MTGGVRARSTPEFEEEAGRLVLGGQMVSSAAKTFCLSDPTPDNRRKAEAAAGLRALTGKAVGAAQREIARLKAEPAKPRMARDILKKRRRISRERRGGIRLNRAWQRRGTGPPQLGPRIGDVALLVHVKANFQGDFQCDEGLGAERATPGTTP